MVRAQKAVFTIGLLTALGGTIWGRTQGPKQRVTFSELYRYPMGHLLRDVSGDGKYLLITRMWSPVWGKLSRLSVYRMGERKPITAVLFPIVNDRARFSPRPGQVVLFQEDHWAIWDFLKGAPAACCDKPPCRHYSDGAVSSPDRKSWLSVYSPKPRRAPETTRLRMFRVADCSEQDLGLLDPADPTATVQWGSLSASGSLVAAAVYSTDEESMATGDMKSRLMFRWLDPPSISFKQEQSRRHFTGGFAVSRDSRRVAGVVEVTKRTADGQVLRNWYVNIFSESGEVIRRLDTPGLGKLTFSPDGLWIAGGYQRTRRRWMAKEVQAVIGIWDVETGEQIGEVAHPWVVEPRSNPWIGLVSAIRFSDDGRYLVTGTQDVIVWSITKEE